jgi:hypothetical protein
MRAERALHAITPLEDGRALISGDLSSGTTLAFSDLYNPATGNFNPEPDLNGPRGWHTATVLNDGRVLVTGGSGFGYVHNSVEAFGLDSEEFEVLEPLEFDRTLHTATLLPDGRVVVIGGQGTARCLRRSRSSTRRQVVGVQER